MLSVVGGSGSGGSGSADRIHRCIAPTASPAGSGPDDGGEGDGIAWVCEGHHFIGKRLRRIFGKIYADATVVAWVPEEGDDQALFSIVQ